MNKKSKMITLRVTEEDVKMMNDLKLPPHYLNVSEYFRNSLKSLYNEKINKSINITNTASEIITNEPATIQI